MLPIKQIFPKLFFLFLIQYSTVIFSQTIRYVKPVQSGSGNGSSWSNASSNIQAMINVSAANDEIWVAMGTYKPNSIPTTTSTTTPRNRTFFMNNGVKLYGGFTGSETLLTQRNFSLNVTTLSGDFNGDDNLSGSGAFQNIFQNTENAYHVILAVSTTSVCTIDGFTIKGGNADANSSITVFSKSINNSYGGSVHSNYSTLIIDNCIIKENAASRGAGVYNYASMHTGSNCRFANNLANVLNPTGGAIINEYYSNNVLTNCSFTDNLAMYGAGVTAFTGSNLNLTNCTFSLNTTTGSASRGGAIYNSGGSGTLNSCIFISNTADGSFWGGGAISAQANTNMDIVNCLFINNSVANVGGAIYDDGSAALNILNSTFIGNYANGAGGGGAIYNTIADPIITNCIIWGNTGVAPISIASVNNSTPTVSYSIIEGGYTGTGNSSSNPLFFNISNKIGNDNIWRTADDGLRLKCYSPGFNTGSQASYALTDMMGIIRPQFGRADMGAYESAADLLPAIVITGTPMACGIVSLTASGGTTYTWSGGQSPTSAANTFTLSGTYNLTVAAVSGCTNSAVNSVTVNACTGISEITTDAASVYPNPVSDILTIQLTSNPGKNQALEIYDITGKLVLKQNLINEITPVKISQLENGVYMFKVLTGSDCIKIGKILKQ